MAWLNWGRWVQPPLSLGYWHGWSKAKVYQDLGLPEVSGSMMIIDGHFFYDQEESDRVVDFYFEKLFHEPEWFDRLIKKCGLHSARLEEDSSKLNENDFVGSWIKFSNSVREVVSLWTLGAYHSEFSLTKAFEKIAVEKGLRKDELLSYIHPTRPARLALQQNEAKELKKKIVDAFPEKMPTAVSELKANPELYAEVSSHLERFGWVGMHHFVGEGLSFDKLLEVNAQQRAVSEEKQPPEDAAPLIALASELGFWRQYLAETTGVCAFNALSFLKKSAVQVGLKEEDYAQLADFEYLELLENNKKADLDLVSSRMEKSGLISNGDSARIISGLELDNLLKKHVLVARLDVTALEGSVACKGKIIGIAKIVVKPSDVLKIEQGDIMIAPETAPDFVVALRKCSAVVTDQGGVTSHAAIVSRELGIPCVVGTKIATQIFTDGDKIEVDAFTGVVKKL